MQTGLLDPQSLIDSAGPWALVAICAVIFAETGLLVGFFLPGDTLLFFAGVLTLTGHIVQPLWLVNLTIGVAATLGAELGYLIGKRAGPTVFNRRESGLFSISSVDRTNKFFPRFGAGSVLLARFVPVVRTFLPVAAGVGHMRRRIFSAFNIAGAFAWTAVVTCAGYLLGQIPGVADFVSRYIDLVLGGIVVLSVGPVIVRAVLFRRARARSRSAKPEEAPLELGPENRDSASDAAVKIDHVIHHADRKSDTRHRGPGAGIEIPT
jgi:Uncharacterized membrane-associated protein